MPELTDILIFFFVATQVGYLASFLVEGYFFTRPVNLVDPRARDALMANDYPHIVLFYPVLNESEATMRTTFRALAKLDYPVHRFEIVAIPNHDDELTIAALRSLQRDFHFIEILAVPSTDDPAWNSVWARWDANDKVYWWHRGARAGVRALPPKKTRQLIYAFHHLADRRAEKGDFLINYIDADSAPPRDHFISGALGMQHYDVLQSTNIAGNLNATMAASLHAFDHMVWDGRKYPHLSANGAHPYWVLGKGLFFRASDLIALGDFNPWITIEDPEVGMRFWKNGKRLGIIPAPLIEEVPATFGRGITQRKRWVAGFFQSLSRPLDEMGFTRMEKVKAWLNFIPCMSLWINSLGIPLGIWAIATLDPVTGPLPLWTLVLAAVNIVCFLVALITLYASIWRRTALVLARRRDRLWYLLRVNPLFLWGWWLIWLVPLWIGWRMYRRDEGLVWERTHKIDANHDLVRQKIDRPVSMVMPIRQPRDHSLPGAGL